MLNCNLHDVQKEKFNIIKNKIFLEKMWVKLSQNLSDSNKEAKNIPPKTTINPQTLINIALPLNYPLNYIQKNELGLLHPWVNTLHVYDIHT